jgi:hypothetical protein
LEVFLGGLSQGELVLATPPRAPVELDAKGEGEKVPDKIEGPTPDEIGKMRDAAYDSQAGAGDGQSG